MVADPLSLNPGLGHSLSPEVHHETRSAPSAWALLNHAKSVQALLSTSPARFRSQKRSVTAICWPAITPSIGQPCSGCEPVDIEEPVHPQPPISSEKLLCDIRAAIRVA